MMRDTPDHQQTMQRVKVGLTGLAGVVVLIGLASAVFSSAARQHASVVANSSVANVATVNQAEPSEPLAAIGVEPSANDEANSAAPAKPANR